MLRRMHSFGTTVKMKIWISTFFSLKTLLSLVARKNQKTLPECYLKTAAHIQRIQTLTDVDRKYQISLNEVSACWCVSVCSAPLCCSPPVLGCSRSPGEAWRPCMAAWRTSSGCWTSDRTPAAAGSTASPSSSPRPRRATPPRSDWWRSATSSVEGEEEQRSETKALEILIFTSAATTTLHDHRNVCWIHCIEYVT